MKAARLYEYGKPLRIEDIPVPEVRCESVLVRIGGAGVCHSDIHLVEGRWKAIGMSTPFTPGHENAGWVEEVGDRVEGFKKGDKVLVHPAWGCGLCRYCREGLPQLCERGGGPGLARYDGGWAEYLYVPSYRFLVKVNDLPHDPAELAPLTDAGLTPFRAVKKVARVLGPESRVLVFGAGGLGQYGIQLLKALTHAEVYVVAKTLRRVKEAEAAGADHFVAIMNRDLRVVARDLLSLTGGKLFDAVVDFVCNDQTLNLGLRLLQRRGVYALVGLMRDEAPVLLPVLGIVCLEHTLVGSFGGTYGELIELVGLVRTGKIKVLPVAKYKLEDVNSALNDLKKGKVTRRPVLVP